MTAEATPHHFALTHERVRGLRHQREDEPAAPRGGSTAAAIRQGLKDGTIDVIATDHAPHHYDAKEREFDEAPNGIIGLETALGLAIRELVESGLLSLPGAGGPDEHARRADLQPAGRHPRVGAPADVVVFDPAERWMVKPEQFRSKSRNTPYAGAELIGRAHQTVVRGRIVFDLRGA